MKFGFIESLIEGLYESLCIIKELVSALVLSCIAEDFGLEQ